MYKVKIKTKYNTIELQVENINTPELKEIFNQPYVEEVYIETTEHYKNKLIQERNSLLNHVVGMTYNTEKALELTKRIENER